MVWKQVQEKTVQVHFYKIEPFKKSLLCHPVTLDSNKGLIAIKSLTCLIMLYIVIQFYSA